MRPLRHCSNDTPLTLRIEKNRLVDAQLGEPGAARRLLDATRTRTRTATASASSRSARTSSCAHVIGHILQDEKFPGVHIAFGNPYGAHTGADWYSSTHIDVVGTKFDIWVDEQPIMRRGQFLIAPAEA